MRKLILLFWLIIASFWAAALAVLVLNVVGVRILYYQGDVLTAVEMLGKRPFMVKSLLLLSLGLVALTPFMRRYLPRRRIVG